MSETKKLTYLLPHATGMPAAANQQTIFLLTYVYLHPFVLFRVAQNVDSSVIAAMLTPWTGSAFRWFQMSLKAEPDTQKARTAI